DEHDVVAGAREHAPRVCGFGKVVAGRLAGGTELVVRGQDDRDSLHGILSVRDGSKMRARAARRFHPADSGLRRSDSVTPGDRARPTGAVDVATDDDDWVTVDRWPREVFRAHYHDADFNWIIPMRAGRLVLAVESEEITVDGDHWACVFPRVAH